MPRVRTGLEVLCGDPSPWLGGRRVGLLAHPASVTRSLVHALDALRAVGADLRVLFGPEHGITGEAQDMVGVTHGGGSPALPALSLYGDDIASLSPQPSWLADLDVVVIDLQDVGSRYYTFVWTAVLMARACTRAGVDVLVCDRPNPLGGLHTAGAPQRLETCSFVGLIPLPVRHGLTLGEVLQWVAREERMDHVRVIPMEGWQRTMSWRDSGLPWVAPSPNMPTDCTARVYPGGCLMEGTNLSEGRGTTQPFEIVGAPWLDGQALAAALVRDGGGGCIARALTFRPTFHKHAGKACGGVQVHVTDAGVFDPYRAYLSLLREARRAVGFAWRTERYEFVDDRPAIDMLTGDPAVRLALDAGADVDDIMDIGRDRLEAWNTTARDRWIYP